MGIETFDFGNMTIEEAMVAIRNLRDPRHKALLRWLARAAQFEGMNQNIRVTIADAERAVEKLTGE
jgi:hypothetical protein